MQADTAREPSPNAQGLSIAHIFTHASLEYSEGGNLVHLRTYHHAPAAKNPGLRGAVKGFSKASRGRLIRKVSSIPQEKHDWKPQLVTMTYPAQWPGDARVWKRHLAALRARLFRKYGKHAAVWRMEYQLRGAPHFHLIVFMAQDIDKQWLSQAWYEIVGSGDPRHLRSGTSVERLRTWRGGASYAAKYCAKLLTGGDEEAGRVWGVWEQKLLEIIIRWTAIDPRHADRIRRAIRHINRAKSPKRKWRTDQQLGMWYCLSEADALRLLEV